MTRYSAVATVLSTLLGGVLHAGPIQAQAPTDSLRAELEAARAAAAPEGIAYAHNDLGLAALRVGDYEQAVMHFDSARVIRSTLPDTLAWARATNNLGVAHHQWGRLEPALVAWEEAESLWRATGDDHGVATVLTNVGRLYDVWGAYERAIRSFGEAVRHARRDGDGVLMGYALQSLGASLVKVGDLAGATTAFDESMAVTESVDPDEARSVRALVGLGRARLRLAEGDPAGTVLLLEALFDGRPEEAFTDRQGETLLMLGDALAAAGNSARAEVIYRRALELARGAGQSRRRVQALEGLVALDSARGNTEATARHLAEISEQRREMVDRSTEERLVALEARLAAERAIRDNLTLRRDRDVDRAMLARQRQVGLLGLGLLLSLASLAAFVVYGNRIERRQRAALEVANTELREAMAEVRTLKRMIPICANCKRIRSDAGFWESVESYMTEHAGASFSHSICGECGPELYGEMWDESDDTEAGP